MWRGGDDNVELGIGRRKRKERGVMRGDVKSNLQIARVVIHMHSVTQATHSLLTTLTLSPSLILFLKGGHAYFLLLVFLQGQLSRFQSLKLPEHGWCTFQLLQVFL